MHPVIIPNPFPGASESLLETHRMLVEASDALLGRWESIIGEPSSAELLQILETKTDLRRQLSSYLDRLQEEVAKTLAVASRRVIGLRNALQAPHCAPEAVTEYNESVDLMEALVDAAEDYSSKSADNQLEIEDLMRRIRHLERT